MTAAPLTESDRTAADVAWDLEPLVEGRGPEGVDALFDDAEARAHALASYRGRIGELDVDELATLMRELATIQDAAGRAGSYAGLKFAENTADPAAGALMARAEERGTAIANELIFIELEWAEVPDERADELLAHDDLAFCRHYLAAARRYRPHLLSEPEERIL